MDAPAPTYMHTRIQLKRGRSAQFTENMGQLVRLLEADYGWHLVGGFMSSLGRIGEVVHVWRVPSANAVTETLAEIRKRPDVIEWSAGFAESVDDEAFFLMTPMPYSPAQP